jgi:GH18 family chitinase
MIESKGMITKDTVASSGDNAAMADWKYHWDATALAPYLLNINPPENENVSENSERAHMVTYDSVKSFQVKAQKLAEYKDDAGNSLLGVKIWHIAGDTESGDLVKAVRKFWPKKS